MKLSSIRLFGTLTRNRTHLFSLAPDPNSTSSTRSSLSTLPRSETIDTSPYLRVLNSPLRRCLLTQKVLPIHMLIPLRQLSLPSHPSPSSPRNQKSSLNNGAGIILLPKGIQHPRFERKTGGKGSWVLCHSLALSQLASKGSFKRINTSLSMPKDLEGLKEYTEYQLIKRVEQEIDMYCERAKSWPILKSSVEFRPIRRVRDLGEIEKEGGGRVEMVLDLRDGEGDVVEWMEARRGEGEGDVVERQVPIWRIGGIVRRIIVPPSTNSRSHAPSRPSPSDVAGNSSSESSDRLETRTEEDKASSQESTIDSAQNTPVLDSIRFCLDSTIALFDRRTAPTAIDSTSASTSTLTNHDRDSRDDADGEGAIYVFYSPSSPLNPVEEDTSREVVVRMKKDLVDLWIACWRIGLWKGEGWEE